MGPCGCAVSEIAVVVAAVVVAAAVVGADRSENERMNKGKKRAEWHIDREQMEARNIDVRDCVREGILRKEGRRGRC